MTGINSGLTDQRMRPYLPFDVTTDDTLDPAESSDPSEPEEEFERRMKRAPIMFRPMTLEDPSCMTHDGPRRRRQPRESPLG